MKCKLAYFALVLLFCGLIQSGAAAEGFTDISGLDCEEEINYLAQKDIVSGRGNGEYAPHDTLSRAELVTIILRGFGSKNVEDIEKFSDVPPSHWAYKYVETAYQMGIVSGTTETTFSPEGKVTYEQAVKMLVCAIKKDDKAEEEGGWPDGYIKIADELCLLDGVNAQKGEEITRAQMAQLVYRFLTDQSAKFGYMYDWENSEAEPQYDWIRDEKIRAIYGGITMADGDENGVLKRAEKIGCNAVFMNLISGELPYKTYDGCKQILDEAAENLKGYDMHPFVKINFGDNGYCKNSEFGRFHPGIFKDEYFDSPCQLSQEYWDKQLLERSLMIAGYPIFEGIILDFEMYSGGSSSYACACMCDNCWAKYLADKGYGKEWESVEAIKRNDFVTERDKLDEYNEWNKEKMIGMFAALREKVHKVNPKIIFAHMPGIDFVTGITEGLGTPERPVIVLSEQEYWGSLASTTLKMQRIVDTGINALWLPGLYTGKTALSPEEFEKNVGIVSTTTSGYWIYNASYFSQNEENFAAAERANKLLDERLKTGELIEFPTYEINSYTASKIKGETPTEEEWEKAPYTEDFVHYKKPNEQKPLVLTRAKVLYSDKDIFVRFEAYEDMSKLKPGDKLARDGNLWAGDVLEVYWKFEDESPCAQFATDVSGSLYDSYSTGIGTSNANINYDEFEVENKMLEDRWQSTMRIPGSLDGVRKIKKGDMLRMQISRYHPESLTVEGAVHNHAWAPTHSSYLGTSPLWGYMKLG